MVEAKDEEVGDALMAALPYMQLYPADYLADTVHLTTEEHGAYLLLLMNYWQTGKPLDNRKGKLAKIARLSDERWTDVERTLREFFIVKRGIWKHERVEFDLQSVLDKSTKASFAGKESARKRANSRSPDAENGHFEKKESKSQSTSGKKVSGLNEESPSLEAISGVKEGNGRSTNAQRSFNHTDTDTDTDTDKNIVQMKFGRFWDIYPRKDGKKKAQEAFEKALKKTDVETIMAGLERYVAFLKTTDQKIAMAVTWLNGERWTDEVSSTGGKKGSFDLPHAKTTDPNTDEDYCRRCGSSWPCATISRQNGSQF